MSLTKWSLKKVEFLLSDSSAMLEAVQQFEVQTDLGRMSALHASIGNDSEMPVKVFERLAPFYDAGLLLQSGSDWRVTDFFWRGQVFGLEAEDQIAADSIMREISPLQVNAAHARRLLGELGCEFIRVPDESRGFLFRPSEKTAYVLISNLPELWTPDHVAATMTLLNRSFSL